MNIGKTISNNINNTCAQLENKTNNPEEIDQDAMDVNKKYLRQEK